MQSVPTWEWITILACLALSGFFSGAETAFLTLSRAKFQALIYERRRRSDPLRIWVEKPSALLTSILIGNNLVNIFASALATDIASRIFENRGLAVAVGVMTLVILVFGEITPKVMARRYAEGIVLISAYCLAVFYYLTWPLTRLFTGITYGLIRLTGGDPSQDFTTVKADELQFLVALSAREGGIEKYPAHLIDRVLRFQDKTVKDAMVPRTEVVALEVSDSLEKIFQVVNESGHSRLPVYRESMDEMVGVFHVKDLLVEPVQRWDSFRLSDHLHTPYFVPESAHLGRAIREFQKKRIHLAVVVDEFGGTEGVITLEDILEELVGEIQDEFDREVVMMRRLPSGALEVSGLTPVDDLKKIFPDWGGEIPAKTVGGFIMELTGRVPAAGETVYWEGLRFTILGSSERQIKRVRVESLKDLEATPLES
ncbi:MAG: HlyC/CorC family transporter [bacterium]|nr:MAG: HlyC/CorC family transporter [bacterium]